MSKDKKGKKTSSRDLPKETPKITNNKEVNLLKTMELLHRYITQSLCEEVFKTHRIKERQRKWTLYGLIWFWTVVVLRSPPALTQILEQSRQGKDKLLPQVEASPEAFFEKCKDFHWRFFEKLYETFTQSITPQAPLAYAHALEEVRNHFPEIRVIDGSQLAEVAHCLKILWKFQGALLPGRLFVVYDLFRGISSTLTFEPDAKKSEHKLAQESLAKVPQGALVLGDRLFGLPSYFEELAQRKLWGLFRRNNATKPKILKVFFRSQGGGRAVLEDLLVEVGRPPRVGQQTLRLIRFHQGNTRLELFTNILDSNKLPASKAIQLYAFRWKIERLFFDLKEVLNINHFYAANPNAIAMQVFASAIVYNAFRLAQSHIAKAHGVSPEEISPAKLYPQLAKASIDLVSCEWMWEETLRLNPKAKLHKPNYYHSNFATTTLKSILVEHKKKPRTKGKPNPARYWYSWRDASGGKQWLEKLS